MSLTRLQLSPASSSLCNMLAWPCAVASCAALMRFAVCWGVLVLNSEETSAKSPSLEARTSGVTSSGRRVRADLRVGASALGMSCGSASGFGSFSFCTSEGARHQGQVRPGGWLGYATVTCVQMCQSRTRRADGCGSDDQTLRLTSKHCTPSRSVSRNSIPVLESDDKNAVTKRVPCLTPCSVCSCRIRKEMSVPVSIPVEEVRTVKAQPTGLASV